MTVTRPRTGPDARSAKHVPPHDEGVEGALLGACLLKAAAIDVAIEAGIEPRDFHAVRNGDIYRAITELHGEGAAVDTLTVAERLGEQLARCGDKRYLVELQAGVPAISNAATYARSIKRMSRFRDVITLTAAANVAAYEGNEAAISAALARLNAATVDLGADDSVTARAMSVVLSVRSTKQIVEMPPPSFLIADWIVAGSLLCIYGKPAAFKSLVAQAWAFCLAAGVDWYGHTVTPSTVLYVAAEGSGGLGKRIDAWCQDTGITPDELGDLHWITTALNLLDAELAAGLVAAAREVDADVVIIDTVARSLPGAPENDGPSFSTLVAVADSLRSQGMTVILVHHSPKDGEGMRGHTNLEGAVDTAVRAKREAGQSAMTLTMTKQKDFAEAGDVSLGLRRVAESVVLDRLKPSGTVTANGRRVLELLRDSDGTPLSTGDVITQTGMAKSTANRTVNDLEKQGLIVNATPNTAAHWALAE